jgi:hypothetical protein
MSKNIRMVRLNVGGQKMSTYKTTLSQLEFFKSYLERWNDNDKPLFLDVDIQIYSNMY